MCSRDEVIATARRMLALDLVTGTFGNVSCQTEGRILITPSGLEYGTMHPADLVLLRVTGEVLAGDRAPSSEFRLHVAIYARRPEVRAIVHTHSAFAVEYASSASELDVGESGLLSASIPVAPFRPPGTQDLADGAARLLVERRAKAVILRDHGVVSIGRGLSEALAICVEVERLAVRTGQEPRSITGR